MSTPNRLGDLVQRKGAAPRPAEVPQRGEPAPAPIAEPVQPTPAEKPAKLPQKSLTLKMDEPDYEILRDYAYRHRRTHQEVMLEAVLAYLTEKGVRK
jgi:hypothetical protein